MNQFLINSFTKQLWLSLFGLVMAFAVSAQSFSQIAKRAGLHRAHTGYFGGSVAISGDYAVIGAYNEEQDAAGTNTLVDAGTAYVLYRHEGGLDNWGIIKKIVASDRAAHDWFGWSVGISGDYVVVGAHNEDEDAAGNNNLNGSGSVYIFKKDQGGANNWGEVKKIVAPVRTANDNFGYAVSISGNNLVVGAWLEDEDALEGNTLINPGSAYVFNKDQGGTDNWGVVKKIVASDRDAVDEFGLAVSVSGDYIVVGAKREDNGGVTDAGAAYIFKKDQGGVNNWGEVKKIGASDGAIDDIFGQSVAISGDYVVVGAWQEDEDAAGANTLNRAGSAYIFKKDQGGADNWGQLKKLVNSDRELEDWFGTSVAIDGDNILVGAPAENVDAVAANNNLGSVYLFKKDEGGTDNWGQAQKIFANDRSHTDYFSSGTGVAISGGNIIVGAKDQDTDENGANGLLNAGAAYVFMNTGSTAEALDFDGVDDHVRAVETGLPFGSAARTIELWMQTTSSTQSCLFSYGQNPAFGSPNLFMMLKPDGKIDWLTGSAGTDLNSANTVVNDGQWHHVAFVYDGTTMNIYVDGNLDATRTAALNTVTNPQPNGMLIGAITPNNVGSIVQYFDGRIDELRVWNTARTQGDIQGSMNNALAGNEAGLVRYYNFNHGIAFGDNTSPAVNTLVDHASAQNGTLSNFTLNGFSSNWVDASHNIAPASTDPNINLGDATACQNGSIYIPVELTNGNGIASMSFKLDYDETQLQLVGVPTAAPHAQHADIAAGTFSVTPTATANTNGEVTISWFSGAANSANVNFGAGPTTLFYLEFTTVTTGTPSLSWITTAPSGQISDENGTILTSTYSVGTISVNAAPTAYTLDNGSGGSVACNGDNLTLSGSETGVNYQLKKDGVNQGSVVAGTGSALTFATNGAGAYTVEATHTTTNCISTMTGTVIVTAIPASFNVTGTATYCPSGAALTVSLSGSEVGVNYQLKRNGANEGAVVAGTGNPINFTGLTTTNSSGDNFTVVATNATNTNCAGNMNGSATLTLVCFNVTGRYVYGQAGGNVLKNFTATLKDNANATVQTENIGTDGQFTFENVSNGTGYYIEVDLNALAATSKPHGGINAIDALLMVRHFVQMPAFALGIQTDAGNVSEANTVAAAGTHPFSVNAIDALQTAERYVGITSSFASQDWATEYDGNGTANATFNVAGAVQALGDVLVLAYGDVNRSYDVSSLSNGTASNINLATQGKLEVEENAIINIPFHTQDALDAGAVSLVINYPYDVFEVENVVLGSGVAAQNLIYTVKDGKIRLSWYNLQPLQLQVGEELFSIQAVVHEDLTAAYEWTPTITFGNESELGDEFGNTISNVNLTVPVIVLPQRNVLNASEYYEQTIYPNPASSQTTIEYNLPQDAEVTIELVNSLGMRMQTLIAQSQSAGIYTVQANTSKLTNGTYMIKTTVITKDETTHHIDRLVIIK